MTIQHDYRAVAAVAPGTLQLVRKPLLPPGRGQVRIDVEACGVCHSDAATVDLGAFGVTYPRVPGHEVVGRIDAVGEGVTGWAVGDRVGVGFLHGQDGTCPSCRRGDVVTCDNPVITGATVDGGYAEKMIADVQGLVRVPDDLAAVDAAPLLCAGLTTFNALRRSSARAGDLVVVHGVGGLGHLAVQLARRMGFHVVAVGRGSDRAELAVALGAHRYIDTDAEDTVAALQAMGGARLILATAPTGAGMAALVPALAPRGTLVVVAAANDAMPVMPTDLIFGGRTVRGALTGTVADNEEGLAFSVLQDVRPMVETYPLERAAEAYARMMKGDVRFRAVLVMNGEHA